MQTMVSQVCLLAEKIAPNVLAKIKTTLSLKQL
jgi:hypothetical protein